MKEQFYRSAYLIGAENIRLLSEKTVVVFGLGGVGSYIVEALARGGIGNFLLVDSDEFDITNINRQLPATLQTVGMLKTEVVKQRILSINPDAVVNTKEVFVLPDNLAQVLDQKVDYIIDAIDTISAKLAIAQYGFENSIPTISCMGTGNKLDPTQFQISDIYSTSTCPLCRVMRKELKRRNVTSLKVLYSTEAPIIPDYSCLPPDLAQQAKDDRTPGSVSFVPPVAGMIIGGEVIKDLIRVN